MTNDEDPIGTVADETAKLAEALRALTRSRDLPPTPGSGLPPFRSDDGGFVGPGSAGSSSSSGSSGSSGSARASSPSEGSDTATDDHRSDDHRCPTCGHSNAAPPAASLGQDPVCRVCPICRGIDLLRRVSPDTIEQVASFASFIGMALKDIADAQRERAARPRPPADPTPPPRASSEPPPPRSSGPAPARPSPPEPIPDDVPDGG